MKNTDILLGIVLTIFLLLNGCKKNETINEETSKPKNPINLITNSSFELNGQQSLVGWTVHSERFDFTNNTPPGGGNWALEIPLGWFPFYNSVETIVPAPTGSNIYKFSIYGKVRKITNLPLGYADFYVKHADTLVLCNSLHITDTTWSSYFKIDTLTTFLGDSLFVKIYTSLTEVSSDGPVIFDLCKLEKLN
jgi:hypothetical protein